MLLSDRAHAGRKAKQNGEAFEKALKVAAYLQNYEVVQIPSGYKQVGSHKIIRIKTPFDFIFVRESCVLFIDAKSTSSKTFSRSMVKPHQVEDLVRLEKKGYTAGYIVLYKKLNKVVFYKASQLLSLKPGDSLSPESGTFLGFVMDIKLTRLAPVVAASL